MTQKMTDLVKQVVAMLTALAPVLALFGMNPEFLTPESIEQFGILLGTLIALGVTLYGIYMNTFAGKKAFDKAQMKEAQRMIDEGKFDPNAIYVVEDVEEVDAPDGVEDGADLK